MPLINRKSSEEKAAAAEAKQKQQAAETLKKERQQAAEMREKEKRAFFQTPAGQARQAFERADQVFQYSANVMSQKAIVVSMVGTRSPQRTTDHSVILNSVCNEGWELVNGSFVFVETGQQSRDKFMASGQQVATSGATMGYYLFRRSEANRREVGNPWEAVDEQPPFVVSSKIDRLHPEPLKSSPTQSVSAPASAPSRFVIPQASTSRNARSTAPSPPASADTSRSTAADSSGTD